MAEQIVGYRPAQVSRPRRLKGVNLTIGAGTEVVLASVPLLNNAFPVLESLYYDAGAGSTNLMRFRVTLNGAPLPYDWADSVNPIGSVGKPEPIGQALPPGGLLEVRLRNDGAIDYEGYCDGEVCFYDRPIR